MKILKYIYIFLIAHFKLLHVTKYCVAILWQNINLILFSFDLKKKLFDLN